MIKNLLKYLIFSTLIIFASLNIAYNKYYQDINRLMLGKPLIDDNPIQLYSKKIHSCDFLLNHRIKFELLNAIRLKDSVSINMLKDELWNIDSQNYNTIILFKKFNLR